MTVRHANRAFTRHALRPVLAYALVHAAACSGQVDGDMAASTDTPLRDNGASGSSMPGLSGPVQSSLSKTQSAQDCADLATDVEKIFSDFCASCHGNGNRTGGFGDVLDVSRLIDQAKIVPGDAGGSKLYQLVKSGTMPKTPQKPSKKQITTLHDWIECGAVDWKPSSGGAAGSPASFISIDDRLSAIRDDLRSLDNQSDRRRMRYIDLSNLANAGLDEDGLQAQRALVALLSNSLSFGKRVVEPTAVDAGKLLYRIDLRDYAWSDNTWELIVADYPYTVRYDENSPLFSYDEDSAQDIRDDTGTNVPYVQADWFVDHVSQPPLYYDVLQVPEDINKLLLDQGVDVQDDVRNFDVARAGFNGSGIALNNRVIERHELPGFGGSLWLSYDFRTNVDQQNIFAHPSDFRQDGGEGFFTLPNGLQAYFVINADFRRLDKAPPDIVTDPNTRDRAVAAGLSCMGGCHLAKGINEKDDQIRAYVLTTAASADERDRALQLYPEADAMRKLMDSDVDRYTQALATTGMDGKDDTALIHAVRTHEDTLSLSTVAAVLGIKEASLNAALDASPQAFPPEIVALRVKGASVYRATFDNLVADVVKGLGLGEQLRADGKGDRARKQDSNSKDDTTSKAADDKAAADKAAADKAAADKAAAAKAATDKAAAADNAGTSRRNRR